jgi:Domain of Unknown Function (DUF326)
MTSHSREMLEKHPRTIQIEAGLLVACIEACLDCAQSCTACADACLGEPDVEMLLRCITLCLNCSDVCTTTEMVVTRQTEFVPELARAVVGACSEACRMSGDECERHAPHHAHCRVCAEVCRRCEQACEAVRSVLSA